MEEEDKFVYLDSVIQHGGTLHKVIQNSGRIKFKNFPFGIKFVGTGGGFVEIQLFAVPVGVKTETHIAPTFKKPKPKPVEIETKEKGQIEL